MSANPIERVALDAIEFIEDLTADPLLDSEDVEMRLEDVQAHAGIEAASLRKRLSAALEAETSEAERIGLVLVPREPTEAMWGGLARDIVMWTRFGGRPTGATLHAHLRHLGRPSPDWLLGLISDDDMVPPKGTVAFAIYRAMVEARPAALIPEAPAREGE